MDSLKMDSHLVLRHALLSTSLLRTLQSPVREGLQVSLDVFLETLRISPAPFAALSSGAKGTPALTYQQATLGDNPVRLI
jgi:hypothetical protein